MAVYSLHVFCDDCNETHPMKLTVELAKGPKAPESVGEFYDGDTPPEIETLMSNRTICPASGRILVMRDPYQVFLQRESDE